MNQYVNVYDNGRHPLWELVP